MPSSADEMSEYRMTITIEDATLPSDSMDRQLILDTLTDVVLDILGEGLDVSGTTASWYLGYRYAEVDLDCPDCGTTLKQFDIHRDDDDGAFMAVRCPDEDCDWDGDAVYRATDLRECVGDDEYESSVLDGTIAPRYTPY